MKRKQQSKDVFSKDFAFSRANLSHISQILLYEDIFAAKQSLKSHSRPSHSPSAI